ncbi:hypothetical protein [Paenibacillus guangzhouensis]|uniref:hypothetical protein n=1 Tax=Paenibacillus guangzhouensis TaxID=1473112 RepID=UPI002AAFF989|nr:hypothetical protein [Paenibacillus guangzhouensis]
MGLMTNACKAFVDHALRSEQQPKTSRVVQFLNVWDLLKKGLLGIMSSCITRILIE